MCCFQDEVDETYDLVLVGHSLGAGTAAILAILLRQEYPTLHCYAFSPPGGLLRYKTNPLNDFLDSPFNHVFPILHIYDIMID